MLLNTFTFDRIYIMNGGNLNGTSTHCKIEQNKMFDFCMIDKLCIIFVKNSKLRDKLMGFYAQFINFLATISEN